MTKRKYWEQRIFRTLAAFLLLGLTAQTNLDEPFGLSTVTTSTVPLSTNWNDLQSQIDMEQAIVAQCRGEAKFCSSRAAARFVAILNQGEQHDGIARIGHINRAANLAIRATKKYFDKWTSPLETLARGVGDCKQYAVLKYVALNEAGYDADRLRIVIVEDKMQHLPHAVVAVRSGGQWIVLDNRSYALVESSEFLKRYTPVAVVPQLLQRELHKAEHKIR